MKKFKIPIPFVFLLLTVSYTFLVQCSKDTSDNESLNEPIKVTSVSVSPTSLSFVEGSSSQTLVATISPKNARDTRLTWSSSDVAVATVSDGTVTPISAGTATITVTTTDGAKTATCDVTVTKSTKPVTGVDLNQTMLSLTVGDPATTLNATVSPADASDPSLTWSSSNVAVATVSDGTVTPISAGTATITVTTTDGAKTATCDVTVTEPTKPVTGVDLDQTMLSLTAGDPATTLSATVSPADASDPSLTWSSSDVAVATVSDGTVTPVSAGTATITVTTTDGAKTATCDVTVTASRNEVLTIVNNKANFVQYKVSQTEFDLWNSENMTSKGGESRIKAATAEIYSMFNDKFDFIFFMLNNPEIPQGMPYGQAFQVSNNVSGLGGLSVFDNSANYGSSGQLQHIVNLYKLRYSASSSNSYLIVGPILHEMGHRWFNFSTKNPGLSHWPNYSISGAGIFAKVTNDFAPIELYLMGLINYNDIAAGTIDKSYADGFISESGKRIPDKTKSQKAFRGLVVVVTPTDMTDEEIAITDNGVDALTSTSTSTRGVNFYRQTGKRATLKLNGLLDPDTKK